MYFCPFLNNVIGAVQGRNSPWQMSAACPLVLASATPDKHLCYALRATLTASHVDHAQTSGEIMGQETQAQGRGR